MACRGLSHSAGVLKDAVYCGEREKEGVGGTKWIGKCMRDNCFISSDTKVVNIIMAVWLSVQHYSICFIFRPCRKKEKHLV